jgi:hypothetical protein
MRLLTRLFSKKPTAEETKAPTATVAPAKPVAAGVALPETVEEIGAPIAAAGPAKPIAQGVACPECGGLVTGTKGSPVSPYLGQYHCTKCSWRALTCGRTGCEGYLTPEEMGYADTVRYNCVKCGWTGTGTRY